MNNCKKIQKLLPAYHYKELSGEKTGAVKEHLASCDMCARRYEKMVSMLDMVGKKQPRDPPDDLLDTYISELNKKIDREITGRSAVWSFTDGLRLFLLGSRMRIGMASVALVVIVFSLFLLHDPYKIGLSESSDKLAQEVALMEFIGEEEDSINDTEEAIFTEITLLAELDTTSTQEETETEDIEDELELLESLDEDEELWRNDLEEDVLIDELLITS